MQGIQTDKDTHVFTLLLLVACVLCYSEDRTKGGLPFLFWEAECMRTFLFRGRWPCKGDAFSPYTHRYVYLYIHTGSAGSCVCVYVRLFNAEAANMGWRSFPAKAALLPLLCALTAAACSRYRATLHLSPSLSAFSHTSYSWDESGSRSWIY